jgi:hypothetical protein
VPNKAVVITVSKHACDNEQRKVFMSGPTFSAKSRAEFELQFMSRDSFRFGSFTTVARTTAVGQNLPLVAPAQFD